jgi:hypothetical protein
MKTLVIRIATLVATMAVACSSNNDKLPGAECGGGGGSSRESNDSDAGLD